MFRYLFQSTIIPCTKIDHVTIHDLVLKHADKLSAPVLKNLRKLIIDIDGILDSEKNATVFIYISELPASQCLKMGEGKQIILILIDEDGIHSRYPNILFWRKMKPFVSKLVLKCIDATALIFVDQLATSFWSVLQS